MSYFFGKVIGLYGYMAIRLKGYVVIKLLSYDVIQFNFFVIKFGQELFHPNPGPGAKDSVPPLPSSQRKSRDATFPCMGKELLNIAH